MHPLIISIKKNIINACAPKLLLYFFSLIYMNEWKQSKQQTLLNLNSKKQLQLKNYFDSLLY